MALVTGYTPPNQFDGTTQREKELDIQYNRGNSAVFRMEGRFLDDAHLFLARGLDGCEAVCFYHDKIIS